MQYLNTPLGMGILLILLLFTLVYVILNRKQIARWLKRARITKVSIGPFEVESGQNQSEKSVKQVDRSTVEFGQRNKFSGSIISKIAGRDIAQTDTTKSKKGTSDSSVHFGENSDFSNTEIDTIAGRDIEIKDRE